MSEYISKDDNIESHESLFRGFTYDDALLVLENNREFYEAANNEKTNDLFLVQLAIRIIKKELFETQKAEFQENLYTYAARMVELARPERKVVDTDVKTLKGWHDSGISSFDKYFSKGDIVAEEVVDHFMDCLPPASFTGHCSQMGEAQSSRYDDQSDKYRTTYMTFSKDTGAWVYCGNCFRGEVEERGKELQIV